MTDLSAIRRLARAGLPQRAWDALCAARLERIVGDIRVLTLKGRILKDRAWAASGANTRKGLLRQAAEAYSAAAALTNDSYPRINAATLVYLRGDRAAAATLAADLLDLIDGGEHGGETPYWLEATRAEALLLMGRIADADASLRAAIRIAPDAREDRAATLRQLRRIIAFDGADDNWLDTYALSPVLHFRGPLGIDRPEDVAAITDAVTTLSPGVAIGALAAGTDIIAAEAALAAGASLHIMLPAPVSVFRATSVAVMGQDWGARFDRLIDAATEVEAIDEAGGMTAAAVMLAETMAVGIAASEAAACDCALVLLGERGRRATGRVAYAVPHTKLLVDVKPTAPGAAAMLSGRRRAVISIAKPDDDVARVFALNDVASWRDQLFPGCVVNAFVTATRADAIPMEQLPRMVALISVAKEVGCVVSRSAAFALQAIIPDSRAVLAGSVDCPCGPFDFFDLIV